MVAATARFIPPVLHVDALMVADDGLTIRAVTDAPGAHCPLCGEPTDRVHSRPIRTLADLPWADVVVHLQVQMRQMAMPGDGSRFGMLETIRDYGLERLDTSGEADAVRDAHTAHYLALAEEAKQFLLGPEQVTWLVRLEADHDNLRAALYRVEQRGDDDALLRLVTALGEWWDLYGHFTEGRDWLERALACTGGAPPTVRVQVLLYAGSMAYQQGDQTWAEAWLEEALALARQSGATRYVSYVLSYFGVAAEDRGEYALAVERLTEAAVIAHKIADRYLEAVARSHLGVVAYGQGDLDAAVAQLEAATTIAGDDVSPVPRWVAAIYLALIACDRGNLRDAVGQLRIAFGFRGESAHDLVRTTPAVATLAVVAGQPVAAARLFGATEALREAVGLALAEPERTTYKRAIAAARAELGAVAFGAAWSAGLVMTREGIMADVAAVLETAVAEPSAQANH